MRLYRGLKHPYRPDLVKRMLGTDFTDCPYTALQYARGRHGVLIVIDVPEEAEAVRISREDWFDKAACRFIMWGSFDAWIKAIVLAREARAVVRIRGVRAASDRTKSEVLRRALADHLAADPPPPSLVPPTWPAMIRI